MITTKKHENGEKILVSCWAILDKNKKILVFLDESVLGYKEQLKEYNRKGFLTVCLSGETFYRKEEITFTKESVIEKLDPYFMKESIDVIVRKLGFKND